MNSIHAGLQKQDTLSKNFMDNINEIMKFTKKDKELLPDTKVLVTKNTMYIFEVEIIKQ